MTLGGRPVVQELEFKSPGMDGLSSRMEREHSECFHAERRANAEGRVGRKRKPGARGHALGRTEALVANEISQNNN